MFIDSVDNKIIVKLDNFDIDKTNIEFGDDFHIDTLIVPKYYKNKENDLLFNIKNHLKGEIEYI